MQCELHPSACVMPNSSVPLFTMTVTVYAGFTPLSSSPRVGNCSVTEPVSDCVKGADGGSKPPSTLRGNTVTKGTPLVLLAAGGVLSTNTAVEGRSLRNV